MLTPAIIAGLLTLAFQPLSPANQDLTFACEGEVVAGGMYPGLPPMHESRALSVQLTIGPDHLVYSGPFPGKCLIQDGCKLNVDGDQFRIPPYHLPATDGYRSLTFSTSTGIIEDSVEGMHGGTTYRAQCRKVQGEPAKADR